MATYPSTPVPVDSFTRYMANMFDERQIISVPTGFQAFFGNPGSGGITHFSPDANVIDIDIIRGNKRTAALIPRGAISRPLGSTQKDMQTGKHTAFSRKFPLSEEEGNIGANDLLYRMPGETPYGMRTRLERMRDRATDLHLENIRRHVRLFEILAMNSILYGTMPAILGTSNADLIYNFMRKSTHTFAVSTAWNGAGDPLTDLDTACDLLEADGNISPRMLCLGGQAMQAMVGNSTFQTLADNRRIEFIRVSRDLGVPPEFARFVQSGWVGQGRLRTPKGYELWIFTYNRTYHNSSGVSTKLMPETIGLVTSPEARCDRYFGPPEMLPMITQRVQLYRDLFGFDPSTPPMPMNVLNGGSIVDPSMFYCDAYIAADGKSVSLRTQSAPIFATTQTDAFVTMTGLYSAA